MFGIDITNIIKVNKNSITPIKIMDNLSTQQLETFYANSYKFPGIFVGIVPKRVYPYGDEYAHILGYVGLPSQKDLKEYNIGPQSLVGKAGIEKRFNKYLIGELGYKK
jgi:peptidoglycan glycosyltransferase (EC 2.4.1.129)